MRQFILLLVVMMLAVAGHAQDFTKSMTAAERAKTGVDRLSPQELEQLKAVVERYKTGEVAVVTKEAEKKVAVAEQKAVVAEAKVKEVEAKHVAVEDSSGEKKPSWLRALITLDKASKEPEKNDVYESRIAGDFKGWRSGTTFNLENGQRWQHVAGEDYVTPPEKSPKVRIYPGIFGTFWMEIEGVKPRVKVKPIRL